MRNPTGRTVLGIGAMFLGLYGLTFHGFVDVEDTEVAYQSTRNLIEHGSLAIGDTEIGRKIIDQGFYVTEAEDGATYPIYPLLQLLLPVPFYVVGDLLSGLAYEKPEDVVRMAYASVNVPLGALICVVVFLLSVQLGYPHRVAAVTSLVAGSCTMLWVYAQGTFADMSLTLFTSASALCLFKASMDTPELARRGKWLVAAGVLHGLAACVRPIGFVLLLPSMIYLARAGSRDWLRFLLPMVGVVVVTLCLDSIVFGRPLVASYAGRATSEPPLLTHSYTLSMLGLLFSDGRGLFSLSPVLLLAILSFAALRRRLPREADLIAWQLATLVFFFAAFAGWSGGWNWGPRYLLPCLPLVAVVVAPWLAKSGTWRKALTGVLIAVSLWIQLLAVTVPHRIYMTAISAHGDNLDQFLFYSKYSPVLAHQKILFHKLAGGSDVYTYRWLFGLPDDREIDVARMSHVEINRYAEGFDHFAWVRVYDKGHEILAVLGILCCLALMGVGLVVMLRATSSVPASARGPGDSP